MDEPYLALTFLTGSWTSSYIAALRNQGIRPKVHKTNQIQYQSAKSFQPTKSISKQNIVSKYSFPKPLSQQKKKQYLKQSDQIQFSDPYKQVNKSQIYQNLNSDLRLLNRCFSMKNKDLQGFLVNSIELEFKKYNPNNLRQLGKLIKYRNKKYKQINQQKFIKNGGKTHNIQTNNSQFDLAIPITESLLSKLKKSKQQQKRLQNLTKQFQLQKYMLSSLISHKQYENQIKLQNYRDQILEFLSQQVSQDLLIDPRIKKVKQLKRQENKMGKARIMETPTKIQLKSQADQSMKLLQIYGSCWEELLEHKKSAIQLYQNKQQTFRQMLNILSKRNLPFQAGYQIIFTHCQVDQSMNFLSRQLLTTKNLTLLELQFAKKNMCSQERANQTIKKYLQLLPENQINPKWCQAYLLLRAGMIKELKYFVFHENMVNQLPCLKQYLSRKLDEPCCCQSTTTMDKFSMQIHFIVTGQCKYSCEQLSDPFQLNEGKDYIWLILKILQVNKQNYNLLKDHFQQIERQKESQFQDIEAFQRFCEKNRNKLCIQWKFYQKVCQQIYSIRESYSNCLVDKLKKAVIGKRIQKKQTQKIISSIVINLLYLWSYSNLIQYADLILSQLDYSFLLTAIIHEPRLLLSDYSCLSKEQHPAKIKQSVVDIAVAKLQILLEKHINFYEKQWNKISLQPYIQASQTSLFQHFELILPQNIFDYIFTINQPKQPRYPTYYTMERNIKSILGLESKQQVIRKFIHIYDFTQPYLFHSTQASSMRMLSKFYHNNYREQNLSMDTALRRSSLRLSSKRISRSTSESRQQSFLNRASFRIEDYENQQSRNLAILLDQIIGLQLNIKNRDYTKLTHQLKNYVKKSELLQKLLLETMEKIFKQFKGVSIYKKYLLLLVEGWMMLKEKKPKMTISSQQFKYLHQCLAKQLNSVGLNAHQWINFTKITT